MRLERRKIKGFLRRKGIGIEEKDGKGIVGKEGNRNLREGSE